MTILPLLLLMLLASASTGIADHVYSHRYVIDGRLIGGDGMPLPGREVQLAVQGDDFLTACREGSNPITDENGDFRFCYHVHELRAGARVTASYGNASAARGIDVAFRRTNVLLREPNETGIPTPGYNETYRISGRAWRPGPIELEGVPVFGEAVIGLPVNLTVHGVNATPAIFQTVTDAYGDFDLEIETLPETDARKLSLTLEAMGRGQPVALDATFHRAYSPIYVSPAGVLGEQDSADDPAPAAFPGAPGSTTPRVNPVLIVALALALVAAVILSRRKSA